ncbi:ABC transporter substrate-binding protein [Agrococcus citreus]|uniref:ABC transporter substrate-binding protein n=1 Tax=Agrococcus citreus TaxID=84643 RepID=A0ABP4JI26_9MICO
MKFANTRRAALAIAAVGALTLAGCSAAGDDGEAAPADPLRIGVIVPLSGAAGPNGGHVLAGIEAQVSLINDAGGIDGRMIEVVSRDDQSTPATGVSAATDLVEEGVDVVMGGWNSPVTLAIQPVLVRADVLNITSIPQNASILGGADPTAIRMNAGNAIGGYTAATYIAEELGAQRVAMMLQNDAYGIDAGAFVRQNLPDSVEVVSEELFEYTDTDFRVAISNVVASNPDALYTANAAESSGQPALMQQLGASNIDFPYFAGTGTVSHTVIDAAGEGSVETMSADLYFGDVEPWASYPKNVTFMERFEEQVGSMPDKFAALGGQSVDVWAQAVANAGSAERQAVADAIYGQTFEDTILGSVSFTGHGQQMFPMFAFSVSDGEITVLDEIAIPEEVWEQ